MTAVTPGAGGPDGNVYTGTPAVVASGLQIGIPYPPTAPQGLTYVVVTNASPFTVTVSQGQVLGQVAAFTADAYPVRSGAPIGVLALPGVGAATVGSDSTVYTTWYQSPPPGNYPAALGAGAVSIQQPTQIVPNGSGAIASLGSKRFPTSGQFDVSLYKGLAFSFSENTGNGPYSVAFQWGDSSGVLFFQKNLIVPAGGRAALALPSLGQSFSMTISNNTGAGVNYSAEVIGLASPVAAWGLALFAGEVLPLATTACPANTLTTVPAPTQPWIYGGPATLMVDLGALAAWQVILQRQDSFAAWNTLCTWGPGDILGRRLLETLMLEPAPHRIQINNLSALAVNVTSSLTGDDWRCAA